MTARTSMTPSPWRQRIGRATLAGWFAVMLGLGAGLLARHVVALPAPPSAERVGAALGAMRRSEVSEEWLAVHVLYAECRCSQRVVDHLVHTARPAGWREIVLWTGDAAPPVALEEHGFSIKRVTAADLARYGIEGAPMLVAVDPKNHVRYLGGYTERKQGPAIMDLSILDASRSSDRVPSLPVFGVRDERSLA